MSKIDNKVFYKSDKLAHVISYSNDNKQMIKDDARSRWAYLIISKFEANQILSGDEKSSDEVLDKLEEKYYPLLENAIKEEEKLITYHTLVNNSKYSDKKKIVLISSKNFITKTGKSSVLIAKLYIRKSKKLEKTQEQTISMLELEYEKAKQHIQDELKENGSIKMTRSSLANSPFSEEKKEAYALISLPYVYNFEDNKNLNSKLLSTIKKDEAIISQVNQYNITGKWTDDNKTEILEHNISDKDKEVYFHIKTSDVPDFTAGKLTIMDEDYGFDDTITTLEFNIKDNEAFILVEFDKIKHNIIKALKDESQVTSYIDELEISEIGNQKALKSNLELYVKVEIKDLNIKKDLAKKTYLKTSVGRVKIGTRSLGNSPYPDSMPPIVGSGPIATVLKPAEMILDGANLEPIHQHIAFEDDTNIGFTEAYENNNKDKTGEKYGMLKTDPEMSGIPNTKLALSKYAWDDFYCDEDTFKESIYQIINEQHFAISPTAALMNEIDLRKKVERGEAVDFTFTPITIYTPENGIRYKLLSENCQTFVNRVVKRYNSIEKSNISQEKL